MCLWGSRPRFFRLRNARVILRRLTSSCALNVRPEDSPPALASSCGGVGPEAARSSFGALDESTALAQEFSGASTAADARPVVACTRHSARVSSRCGSIFLPPFESADAAGDDGFCAETARRAFLKATGLGPPRTAPLSRGASFSDLAAAIANDARASITLVVCVAEGDEGTVRVDATAPRDAPQCARRLAAAFLLQRPDGVTAHVIFSGTLCACEAARYPHASLAFANCTRLFGLGALLPHLRASEIVVDAPNGEEVSEVLFEGARVNRLRSGLPPVSNRITIVLDAGVFTGPSLSLIPPSAWHKGAENAGCQIAARAFPAMKILLQHAVQGLERREQRMGGDRIQLVVHVVVDRSALKQISKIVSRAQRDADLYVFVVAALRRAFDFECPDTDYLIVRVVQAAGEAKAQAVHMARPRATDTGVDYVDLVLSGDSDANALWNAYDSVRVDGGRARVVVHIPPPRIGGPLRITDFDAALVRAKVPRWAAVAVAFLTGSDATSAFREAAGSDFRSKTGALVSKFTLKGVAATARELFDRNPALAEKRDAVIVLEIVTAEVTRRHAAFVLDGSSENDEDYEDAQNVCSALVRVEP